jgi:hypothetical protein
VGVTAGEDAGLDSQLCDHSHDWIGWVAMSFFGPVIRNGQMTFSGTVNVTGSLLSGDGTATQNGIGFAADPGTGFLRSGGGVTIYNSQGGNSIAFGNAGILTLSSAGSIQFGSVGLGTADLSIIRQAPNTVKFFDGSTNGSTVLLGAVDFRQSNSTFAQTATITNGPRAANPVTWVEVKVGGSSGRIPVW